MNNRIQMRLIKSCQNPSLYKEEVQRLLRLSAQWQVVLYLAVAFFILVTIIAVVAFILLVAPTLPSADSFVFWLCEISLILLLALLFIKVFMLNRELYLWKFLIKRLPQ